MDLPDGRKIEYVHDPLGRRIAKKVNGSITEKHLWNGMTQLLAVYDGSNNLLARFEYVDARVPFAMTKGGTRYYLVYDQVGSLRAVTDSGGTVVKRIDYDSFGNIIADSAPVFEVPFGFAGGLHDRDTGLVRFGFRDYDPETGRWTAKDPIGFSGGDWDLYGYVLGDPVNLVDPDGLKIYIRSHGVYGTQYSHASILIVPDNQSLYLNDSTFKKHSNGTVYMTIGAAPSIDGYLVSNVNRKSDRSNDNIIQGEVELPCGMKWLGYRRVKQEAQ